MKEELDPENREQLESDYQDAKKSLEEDRLNDLRVLKEDHSDEIAEIKERIRDEADDDRSTPEGVARKLVMDPSQTSKASSAESILRHCLRATGLTMAWKSGTLTPDQHLRLLEEIRQYGRAWLRHEAGEFVRGYIPTDGPSRQLGGFDMALGLANPEVECTRAIKWITGPDGYLIQKDSGFRHALGRFFGRAKSFVRELILSATMALSGPSPLTGTELEGADRESQKQEQFFDTFHFSVLNPPEKPVATPVDTTSYYVTVEPATLTPGQFVARSESYADSAWQAAQRINHGQAIRDGQFRFERRVLGQPKTEHCEDCPPLAALGWQPIGSLPAIGDSECGPLCLCHFRYSDGEGQPEFIQGKRVPLRAPSEVTILDDRGDVEMIAEPPGGFPGNFPIAGPP